MPVDIPTPNEVERRLTEEDRQEIDGHVARLVAALEDRYEGGSVAVSAGGARPRIRRAVESLFAARGWRLTHHDDQRDGDYWSISRAPKTEGYRDI